MHDLIYLIHLYAAEAKDLICLLLSYGSILSLLLMYFDRGMR